MRYAPQVELFLMEAFQLCLERLQSQLAIWFRQELRYFRVMAYCIGDDNVRTRRQALEPGRYVDHRPEVVQSVVHRDRDARAVVHPGFEVKRRCASEWGGQPLLGFKDRPEGRDRTAEHR